MTMHLKPALLVCFFILTILYYFYYFYVSSVCLPTFANGLLHV